MEPKGKILIPQSVLMQSFNSHQVTQNIMTTAHLLGAPIIKKGSQLAYDPKYKFFEEKDPEGNIIIRWSLKENS